MLLASIGDIVGTVFVVVFVVLIVAMGLAIVVGITGVIWLRNTGHPHVQPPGWRAFPASRELEEPS